MKGKIFVLAVLMGISLVTSAEEEVVRVRAQGIGTTYEEAVRNACRTAVGHVTGTICKERTEINGDKVKQQILTLSSGFITGYEVESSKKIDRGIEVIIRANVLREKLRNRLFALSSGTAPLMQGEPPELQLTPREKQRRDLSRMLIYLLDDYARIFQVIPVNKVVSQFNRKPCVYVNFYLAINPRDWRVYFDNLQKELVRLGFRKQIKPEDCRIVLSPIQSKFYTPSYKIDNPYLSQYYNFHKTAIANNAVMRQLVLHVELLSKNGETITAGDFRIMRPISCAKDYLCVYGLPEADPENSLRKKCTVRLPVVTMDEGDRVERIRYSMRFDTGKGAQDLHHNNRQFIME